MYQSSGREVIEVPEAPLKAYAPFSGTPSIADNQYGYLSIEAALARQWAGMMARCYDLTHVSYRHYGGLGVFVVEEWHDYRQYVADVQALPGWENKASNWQDYQLDKDYYRANYYAPVSCVWVHKLDNNIYKESVQPLRVTDSYGNVAVYLSASAAARAAGTNPQRVFKWIGRGPVRSKRSEMESLLGWSFEVADKTKIYRYKE